MSTIASTPEMEAAEPNTTPVRNPSGPKVQPPSSASVNPVLDRPGPDL